MQLNAISTNYKPLEIQSDFSVSSERREAYKESMQNSLKESEGGVTETYLAPESYWNAAEYLGGAIFTLKAPKENAENNPLRFKNTLEQEQSLASKATYQMQNFLNLPNLTHRNPTSKPNTFGGYRVDKSGFMGEDFNQAANLPSDYKIHKNALQALNDIYTVSMFAEFESIDLIAGISAANQKFNALFADNKKSYTKEEIMQKLEVDRGEFCESDFEALLMQDYKNKDGTFQREGIMLMYAMRSGILQNIESPYTIKREFKEIQNDENPKDTKEKTPEEKAKEIKDALNEYYLKALESSQKGLEHKGEDASIPNGVLQEMRSFKDRIARLELHHQALQKPKEVSGGGEWLSVESIL